MHSNKHRVRHENHIMHTRLHRPPVKDDIVYRPKLIETLNRDYKKNILTLVSAPAGYGKSTLISLWLEEGGIPHSWITLDRTEKDLRTFLEYLVHSFTDLFPGKLGNINLMLQNPELVPDTKIINTLLNELDEMAGDFVLVLDDYHHIENNEIHGFVDMVLEYPPENLHLCIITRNDPPLKIGNLRAYNRLCEIRMIDLAFAEKEISVLYKNLLGFEISADISNKLLETTEGWVTGLRLMAYSVHSPDRLEKLLYEMKGNSLFVTEYLINEVLSAQQEHIQEFLLKSSILERFCSDLLEILSPPVKSTNKKVLRGSDFLNWLENTNMFLIPLDDEHKWYRYHTLFREILLKRLKEKLTHEQISTLNKKICKWFEDKNLIEEAINHALGAGDNELAADIVERSSARVLDSDEWLRLEKWLGMLPHDIVDSRPRLLVSLAWIGKINFNFNLLAVSLNKCQVVLGKHPEKSPLYGEICSLLGYIRIFVNTNIDEGIHFIKSAMKLIPDRSFGTVRAETEMNYLLLMHCSGKNKEAVHYGLNRLYKLNPDKHRLWERLHLGLCFIYLLNADLMNCYSYAKQMREITENKGNIFADMWSRWFMGASSFYKFELEEAKDHFDYVVHKRFAVINHAVIDSIYALALTYQMLGDADKADETVALMEDYAGWTKRLLHYSLLGSLKARLALLRGNAEEAINWQLSFKADVLLPTIGFFISARTITDCAVLTADGSKSSLKSANARITKMMEITKALNYKGRQVELLILQSIVSYKLGKEKIAAAIMKKAVEIAETYRWVFPFIEYGNDAINIINIIIKKEVHAPYCKLLKGIYQKHEKTINTKIQKPRMIDEPISEPLTQRELEILTLLSYGYKNKEIGEKIFLAPTTIKKHVYNIFQKFNVHTRFELITKAKELSLISR
jgi:LuxR family transcriptional regulator, maltose regulon positive regulatory protein